MSRSSLPSYFDQMDEEPRWVLANGRKWEKESV
jgi:hypothetical protein